jgi:hypothetical protein
MKLTISVKYEPVDVLGKFNATDIGGYDRVLRIDGKLVPPGLANIILLGMDVMKEQYLDSIEKQMKEEGHEFYY